MHNAVHSSLYALQVLVLEFIARKRRRGMLRTELAKLLQMEATKFHYVANVSSNPYWLTC